MLEFLVLGSWGLGGEHRFAGISVAQVTQLPFLILNVQDQKYLLAWDVLHPVLCL